MHDPGTRKVTLFKGQVHICVPDAPVILITDKDKVKAEIITVTMGPNKSLKTESIETSLRNAKVFPRKNQALCLANSYHLRQVRISQGIPSSKDNIYCKSEITTVAVHTSTKAMSGLRGLFTQN